MRHLALRLLLAILLLVPGVPLSARETATPASTTAQTVTTPARQDSILTRLPNGLLVYILRDARFPLVCTRLYVRTGSANEEPRHAGISHVLEHMVFKGTEHRPKGQIARDVEALGGYLNAATSFDKTWYLTDMPGRHWRVGMEVVREMAFQATLDPAELEASSSPSCNGARIRPSASCTKISRQPRSGTRPTGGPSSAMPTPSGPSPPRISAPMWTAGTSRTT